MSITATITRNPVGFAAAALFGAALATQTAVADDTADDTQVMYRTVEIDGQSIFYREAGSPDAPTILLLHGFPTSSHMFRNRALFGRNQIHWCP